MRTDGGLYRQVGRYPAGRVDYGFHMRRGMLRDLGVELAEGLADTGQHYTIKIDTTDQEAYDYDSWSGPYGRSVREARVTCDITPVQYRRMEMMINERERVQFNEASDRHEAGPGILARLWKWANEPIRYDGPMPESRPVAAT